MTDSDLLREAAEALESRDYDRLAELHRVADSWLMDEYDKRCLLRCLDAMTAAAEELEELE